MHNPRNQPLLPLGDPKLGHRAADHAPQATEARQCFTQVILRVLWHREEELPGAVLDERDGGAEDDDGDAGGGQGVPA